MAWLDDAGRRRVAEAVTAAESRTSGEIVTVLTDRSDGYTDVALLWATGAAFTAMSVFAAFPLPFLEAWDALLGGWGHQWTAGELASMVIALGLVTFLAVMLVQQWEPLKFFLIPGPTKTIRVHNQAVRQFKVGAERRTTGRTGVLIYLSMREHRAEIVADESIAALVPAEVWGEAMADMLAEIRKGRIAEGLAAGIRDVGFVLAEHFPRGSEDVNELPDRLIEV
ncbi:TPM domain-containing protein [Erythrobacter tepidarius]|uniref:TPM domain-containing protein n=1 Tax=Erythrobacter tepidarius TaxID=60454 RepID=UPI000A3C1113|nr:TPM domain-containing protein [Erythrobacter tepidarius]